MALQELITTSLTRTHLHRQRVSLALGQFFRVGTADAALAVVEVVTLGPFLNGFHESLCNLQLVST